MPLSTYAELKASIANWLNRDDLTAAIPDFIALTEVRLNDRLRLQAMEKQLSIQTADLDVSTDGVLVDPDTGLILVDGSGSPILYGGGGISATVSYLTLPDDFLEMRTVFSNTNPQNVVKLAAPSWATPTYSGLTGYADVYTIIGSLMVVAPRIVGSVTLVYYQKIPALSDTNTTNWLLTRYPQMYLYGSLLEAAPFLGDDTRATVFLSYMDQAIKDAKEADIGARWSNAATRIMGPTP